MTSYKRFSDKIIVITGAASGIGKAIVEKLAAAGAILILIDINDAATHAFAQQLNQQYGNIADARPADVNNAQAMNDIMYSIVAKYGRLDYLFNNAGLGIVGLMQDIDLVQWQRIVQINLMGTVHGCIPAYKIMVQQGSGHIVNTASLAGLTGFPTSIPYSAAKHAVIGLSRAMRTEGKALGIRVTAVCPGFVESNLYDTSIVASQENQKIVRQTPFKRITAAQAADIILEGVLKNRELLIFPFYARLIAWFTWLMPNALQWFYQKNLVKYRQTNLKKN